MPSNPLENDMLLMNEAFREAIGDLSPVPKEDQRVDLIVDGESVLHGRYTLVKMSGGHVKETTVSLFINDPQTAKSALFLVDTDCDLISLGNDIELQGGTIEDVAVSRDGSRYLVTIEVTNYSEES